MFQAVLFDQDGVIIDTERHGHRVAFNAAFARLGYPDIVWDETLYHSLLQIGGGKERIRHYFQNHYHGENPPKDLNAFIQQMHALKTDIFIEMLPTLPLRPGIHRFMRDLRNMRIPIAICTTSHERVARAIAAHSLPDIDFALILAGDMVAKKKPDPEIYLTALRLLNVPAHNTLVVEDSRIGILAATAAGCPTLATPTSYTLHEDLSPSTLTLPSLDAAPTNDLLHRLRVIIDKGNGRG